MDKDNFNEEEPIIKYLYLFSNFFEYVRNSKKNLIEEFQNKKNDSFEKFKSNFRSKNRNNDFIYFRNESALTWLKGENEELKEKAINTLINKVKNELKVDFTNKLEEEEMIFLKVNEMNSEIKEILKEQKLIEIFSEKIYSLMLESNNLFYYIIKMFKNKCRKEKEEIISKYQIEKEDNDKKLNEVMSNNILLKNQIDSLKDLIKKSSNELEELKKTCEEKIEKYRKENAKSFIEAEKKIKENKIENENKIQDIKKQTQQIIDNNVAECKKKIQENQIQAEQKSKIQENKISELEKKIDEMEKRTNLISYEFIQKYREVLDINRNYMNRENAINSMFGEYKKKIIKLTEKNKDKKLKIEKLEIENDEKEIEIESLKNSNSQKTLEIEDLKKYINDIKTKSNPCPNEANQKK